MAKPRFTRRLQWLLTSFTGRRTASSRNENYKATYYSTSLILKLTKKLKEKKKKKIAPLAPSSRQPKEKEEKKLWKVPNSLPFVSSSSSSSSSSPSIILSLLLRLSKYCLVQRSTELAMTS
jgi:hypothetical protein